MLKRRVVAAISVMNGLAVQSIAFTKYLPIGRPEVVAEFYNEWGADEILLCCIDQGRFSAGPDLQVLEKVARVCNVPLTYGGGISSLAQVRAVTQAGADKVVLSTAALPDPSLVEMVAASYGSQAVMVSLDYRRHDSNRVVYGASGRQQFRLSLVDAARLCERAGAGELVVRSIDNDGRGCGYDIAGIREVVDVSSVPVLGAAGAGNPQHILDLFTGTQASGAIVGNMFSFTEHSVISAKSICRRGGIAIRLDTYTNYESSPFDSAGRLLPKSEQALLALRFVHVPKEVL